MKDMHRNRRRIRGFTLVEALVTLLVLSIGLLGVAVLQLTSLRANHSASMRSQATLLAYEVVDRMRANRNRALAGDYDIDLGDTPGTGTVAEDDLDMWKTNLATLPEGDGAIERDVVDGQTIFIVTVQWDDSRGAEAPLAFTMETQI
jgi:type IV pilus assembly protein PilV